VTTTGGERSAGAEPANVLGRIGVNLRAWIAALFRPPRVADWHLWFPPGRLAIGAALTLAAVTALMLLADAWAAAGRKTLPAWISAAAELISEAGRSAWILIPTGIVLLVLAAVATPARGRMVYGVIQALAVRIGFVFLAVGVPGLVIAIVKRLIGRARPDRVPGEDIVFAPFSWSNNFASLPSGHSTTAFAAAVALGALFPRLRVPMFVLAAAVAISRVIQGAHYPSDVLAGAVLGTFGALLVRAWFVSRGLGFGLTKDGRVRPFALPSWRRIRTAISARKPADRP